MTRSGQMRADSSLPVGIQIPEPHFMSGITTTLITTDLTRTLIMPNPDLPATAGLFLYARHTFSERAFSNSLLGRPVAVNVVNVHCSFTSYSLAVKPLFNLKHFI
jgi:hypothetical protein